MADLRTENSDTYRLSDGSYECVVYAEDKYYLDENNILSEIDNSIVRNKYEHDGKSFHFSNAAHSTKIYFSEDAPSLLLKNGAEELYFSLLCDNRPDVAAGAKSNGYTFPDFDLQASNCITYRNLYDGTGVIYKVNGSTIKEYIVLNDADCPSEFRYSVYTSRHEIRKTNDGTIAVYNTDGNLAFEFGKLFAVDSDGDRTDNVTYEIVEETDDTSTIKISVSTDYLYDPDRSFPVLIDPSIMVTGASNTYDTYVSSKYPTTNYYLYNWLRTGRDEDYYTRRTYIKFDLPSGISGSSITSAYINLKYYSGSTPGVKAYRVTGSWSSSTLTWDNKPGYSSTNASAGASLYENNWYRIYATTIVKGWYAGSYNNYGFVLKDTTESGTSQWTTFYSSDAASPNKPELVINYNSGSHVYAGFVTSDLCKGISATIKTPSSYPNVSSSGESVWVSTSKDSNQAWVQAGARYYYNYTSFKTYAEYFVNGVYQITEYGAHALGGSIGYKVEYNTSDYKWHTYISGLERTSSSLSTNSITVQANGETHQANIELGPFTFSNVKVKNSSGTWVNNTKVPTAPLPYVVNGSPIDFTISGP